MKKSAIIIFIVFAMIANAYCQKSTISLTFTAAYYQGSWIQLDSIRVSNYTQSADTVLFYPDTVLVIEYSVGTPDNSKQEEVFRVFQNFPNPVTGQTRVRIFVPSSDEVSVSISDVRGRSLLKKDWQLDRGYHSFYFIPGEAGLIILTATWKGIKSSITILSENTANPGNALTYAGLESRGVALKSQEKTLGFPFSLGDSLIYSGYARISDTINGSDILSDRPLSSETYLFEIIEGIPCPGIPSINFEGQIYTTVQIGDQCWLRENLNVGEMINNLQNQANNGIKEKYCYNNFEMNCTLYGGLYQWDEVMQYSYANQGLCPSGWHLPSDFEWTQLTTFLGIKQIAGGKMKETGTSHWNPPNLGASNSSGFTGLGAGARSSYDGSFADLMNRAYFWSSTHAYTTYAYYRLLRFDLENIFDGTAWGPTGMSARCLKD